MKVFVIFLLVSFTVPITLTNIHAESDDFRFIELNESYDIGDDFLIKFEKTTQQPCPSYEISMMKKGFLESKMTYGVEPLCATPDPVEPYLFNAEFEKYEFFDSVEVYIIQVTLDNETIQKEITITNNQKLENKLNDSFILPPLKQFNSGISYNDIQCRDDKVLVLKYGMTFPACVNPDTVPKLFQRTWALHEVPLIDTSVEQQEPKLIKITGVVNRFDTIEGFEYQFIPIQEELPRIAYTGYDTINLFATKNTVHKFIRAIDGDLVQVQGSFLVNGDEYSKYFSGFPIIPAEKIEIISEHQNLNYTIDGAKIVSITKVPNLLTLNIVLEEAQNGTLEITVPREIIDATIGEVDDAFFVLIDGEEVAYTEVSNDHSRTLTIEFGKESRIIEIIGTVPI